MTIIKFLTKLLDAFFKEKFKFLFLLVFTFLTFFIGTQRYEGEAYKGRFTVDIGSYYSLKDFRPYKNLLEKPRDLNLFLNSHQFFLQFSDKKYKNCPISKIDRSDKNYKAFEKGLFVEIIVRLSSKTDVENCLVAIKDIIFERHNSIRFNYEKLIKMQMNAILEETIIMQGLLEKNKELVSNNNLITSDDLSFGENLLIETEKRREVMSLLSNEFMVEMNELRSLSPWKTNLLMFSESFQKTELFDYRIYQEKSMYYSNILLSSIILILLSSSIFLVFILIRYKKKLNF